MTYDDHFGDIYGIYVMDLLTGYHMPYTVNKLQTLEHSRINQCVV